MGINRERFYKSKKWESFRKIVIDTRADKETGLIYCEECGKAIVHKYDIVLHHVHEIDDVSCQDATIALNPDNIRVICFQCHNKEHERFGYGTYKKPKRKVYLVYGSPCSGKTTWVKENAGPSDLIVDIDSLYQAVSCNPRYVKPSALSPTVFDLRDKLYESIKYRSNSWRNAFVIIGAPQLGERERLAVRLSIDESIFIDTDIETCLKRAESRGGSWVDYVKDWFDKFQDSPPVE